MLFPDTVVALAPEANVVENELNPLSPANGSGVGYPLIPAGIECSIEPKTGAEVAGDLVGDCIWPHSLSSSTASICIGPLKLDIEKAAGLDSRVGDASTSAAGDLKLGFEASGGFGVPSGLEPFTLRWFDVRDCCIVTRGDD